MEQDEESGTVIIAERGVFKPSELSSQFST
jgi:hypothetical protein